MTTNLGGLGWNSIFKNGTGEIGFPVELTEKWWDKNKQLLAKTRATGVGAALKKLKGTFDHVEWCEFSKGVYGRDRGIEDAKRLMRGNALEAMRKDLEALIKLATSEAVIFSKGVTTKATAKTLGEMAIIAERMLAATTAGSLSARRDEAVKDWEEKVGKEILKKLAPVIASIDDTIRNTAEGEKDIKQKLLAYKNFLTPPEDVRHVDPAVAKPAQVKWEQKMQSAHSALGLEISRRTRSMTQVLGNLMKAHAEKAPLTNYKASEIEKLNGEMVRVGSDMSADHIGKIGDLAGPVRSVIAYQAWAKRFAALTKNVEAAF